MKKFNTYHFWLFIILQSSIALGQEIIPEHGELLKIREEINREVEQGNIPSMAIGVIQNGKVVWKEAIGFDNVQQGRKATIHSIYPLGSIAKSLTATGIMSMVNSGELDLFGNVQEYLSPIEIKNSKGEAPEIPLWQLVSQNAGVNQGYGFFSEEALPKSKEEITEFIEKSTIVAFEPGSTYHYSNHSFDLSELIIEKTSGQSFESYMQSKIFQPLGMRETFAYPNQHPDKDFIDTYTASMKKREGSTNIAFPAGGSSWWSSLNDLCKYVSFHLGHLKNPEVLSRDNLKLMHDFRQGPADLFGIGFFNDLQNQTLYSNGNVYGGNAAILIDKKNDLAIITLLNRTAFDGLADQFNGKIKEALYPGPANDKLLEWKRFYGTPYTLKYNLLGTWKGIVEEPKTGKTMTFSLEFLSNGEIELNISDKKIRLKEPTYNLLGNFNTVFQTSLPGIYNKETKCELVLNRKEDSFEGYIEYDRNEEDWFYTMPLFVNIKKL